MVLFFVLPLIAIALLLMPLVPVYRGAVTGKRAKHAVVFHLCAFFGIMILGTILPLGNLVSAAPDTANAAAGAVAAGMTAGEGLKYLAAALSTGLASIGAGIGVGFSAPAAIGACSEDPKAFSKAMIFVVLGEGIAIYGLVISFLILFAS